MKKNNLIRTIKQATAGLLAGAMVLTGAPLGNMTAQAATVLQPNTDLQVASDSVGLVSGTTYGSSDTTSYAFGDSTGKTGFGSDETNPTGPLSSFDLAGIVKESDRSNSQKGYADTLKTGFGNSWWQKVVDWVMRVQNSLNFFQLEGDYNHYEIQEIITSKRSCFQPFSLFHEQQE